MDENTFIYVQDDVLPSDFCEDIIRIFSQSNHKTQGTTSGGVDLEKKNSTDVFFSQAPEFDLHFKRVLSYVSQQIQRYLRRYLFALIGPIALSVKHPKTGQTVKLTQDNFEEVGVPNLPHLVSYIFRTGAVNVQHYQKGVGGYPYWHSEVYPQGQHNEALHRVLLWMFYLNDVDEGGTTDFFYQNVSIKPKMGRMVIAPAYFTHTHRGCAPISNEKFILTSWVLFNRSEQIYSKQ